MSRKTTVMLLVFKNEYNSINEMSEKCGYDGFEKILQAIDKEIGRASCRERVC